MDSWACSPQVITVGNYNNQQHYVDVAGETQDLGGIPGAISGNSSRGPSRTGTMKPDVAAPGDVTFGAGPLDFLQFLFTNAGTNKMIDSLHMRNGGTSIASPVVTGTAALLLQKCPRASNIMVRDAINGSAFADDFTGVVPNIQYGHGKVNVFNALVSTNVFVVLTGDTTLCAGDSLLISGPDFMYRYHWNTGAEQRDVWTTGDTLQLTVETPQGCKGTSDTLIIVPLPLPVASISVDGLEMTSSPATEYQWYLDNVPLADADGQVIEAEANGSYFVQVTDSLGCSANSDTVLISTVGITGLQQAALLLWPVPVKHELNIRGLGPTDVDPAYDIMDAVGRSVQRGMIRGGSAVIHVDGLANGLYLLRLRGVTSDGVLRFVKQ